MKLEYKAVNLGEGENFDPKFLAHVSNDFV